LRGFFLARFFLNDKLKKRILKENFYDGKKKRLKLENIIRCDWCTTKENMIRYHDVEWGTPSGDDRHHFEHIVLEIFQAGLSWQTILNKRDNFRRAFMNFQPEKIAGFSGKDIERLLLDSGIIRNKMKIGASINNAGKFLEVVQEFGSFVNFIKSFRPQKQIVYEKLTEVPASTPESEVMSKELKSRGFKFVGSTGCYAYMQSVGLVNDHYETCFRFHEINRLQKEIYPI